MEGIGLDSGNLTQLHAGQFASRHNNPFAPSFLYRAAQINKLL
jgi:hypothetical protein